MKKTGSVINVLCFSLFITVFAALLVFSPDKEMSVEENRRLARLPSFSFSELFSGRFTRDFESWITDQFPFRDSWISLKSRAERLSGKSENNNVFFASDDTLISRFPAPDMSVVDANTAAVRALGEYAEVYLSLIPTAADVWSDRLPAHADTADQRALTDYIYHGCGVNTVDTRSALYAHRDEYIYYRTDHHWTTLGAYYGYAALCSAMGLEPVDGYVPRTVSDSFYGTVYSSSGVRWVPPDSIDIYVPAEGVRVTDYDGEEHEGTVYDLSKLDGKDKYAVFFGGNTPRMVIETGGEGGRLLLIRDSYSDCELPFLFAHFSRIDVLDLRYYRMSVKEYIEENRIDAVVVNYGLSSFCTDLSPALMGM
ncbi:MAG: hypothetical protein K5855_08450 [Oscillospiraceae bacterium]|nr:hypothetical protein [Oscillospiraceae bacterium]